MTTDEWKEKIDENMRNFINNVEDPDTDPDNYDVQFTGSHKSKKRKFSKLREFWEEVVDRVEGTKVFFKDLIAGDWDAIAEFLYYVQVFGYIVFGAIIGAVLHWWFTRK